MKSVLCALLLSVAVCLIPAQEPEPPADNPQETTPSFFRNDDLERLSVWFQQEDFVRKSGNASLHLPGAGQLMNGNTLSGGLYLTASAAIGISSAVFAYILLPADLKYGNINPFTDSFSYIEDHLKAHGMKDFLPSLSVVITGSVLESVLGAFSKYDAEKLARKNIEEGKVRFSPDPEAMLRKTFLRSR